MPHELPSDLRLRILGNKEILEKSQIWVQTNKTLAIAVKKHAKVDIKLFFLCPVLLGLSISCQIFCP